MAEQHLGGVYVANVTPFKDDATLGVDDGAYLEHVAWLSGEGVRGVVPFGTNGEGPSVSPDEKLRVLGALFGRETGLQVIPAVMQGNLPDTLRMIEFLNGHPAAAVLVLPPYYFKPAGTEGLKRFYASTRSSPTTSRSTPCPSPPGSSMLSRSGALKTPEVSPATRRPCSGRVGACSWAPKTTCAPGWG